MKNIYASLTYGKPVKGFGLIITIAFTILIGVGIIFLTIYAETYIRKYNQSGYVFLLVALLSFFAILIFFIVQNFILLKRIKIWIRDAVELTAKTSCSSTVTYRFRVSKLSVSFRYNGKKIQKFTGDKKTSGYSLAFNKIANREIQILYSPKYDQVLFLKD